MRIKRDPFQSVVALLVGSPTSTLEFLVLLVASLTLVFGVFFGVGWPSIASDAAETRPILLSPTLRGFTTNILVAAALIIIVEGLLVG